MKKLKGITILESVIAMVITVIVMGMASVFYLGITKTVINFTETSKLVGEMQQFYFLFKMDVNQSQFIFQSEEKLQFEFASSANKKIEYVFAPNYLLRIQNESGIDTFHFKSLEPELGFIKKENEQFGTLVERISLELQTEKTKFSIDFKKNYPKAVLINLVADGH